MRSDRFECLDQDIVKKQRKRFEILEERVKQMLEQKSLNGGDTKFNTKQLKDLMD